jgi:RNA polymerase sigma factor (sigma-70 family)
MLLKLAIDGCDPAWHELVRRYGDLVRRVATRTGLTAADASDACQATWIRLIEHADSIREPRALAGWLVTTARRESIRISMRARRERPDPDIGATAVTPSAEAAALEHELEARLALALEDLEPHHRRLLLLLLSDAGLSYAEIARSLGMPIGSIGPMRGRSLLMLRRKLDPRAN